MKEITQTAQKGVSLGEIVKKKKNNRFHIFLICSSFIIAVLTIMGLIDLYNFHNISPEMKELYSLQNEASAIKNNTLALKKRIEEFNEKIDAVLNSKEKYPIGEPIPEKINPCKILAEKETP